MVIFLAFCTLQHTATHCNALQHTATHCNKRTQGSSVHPVHEWHAVRGSRCTATHCNTLQQAATYCNVLQHITTHCNTLEHICIRRPSAHPAHEGHAVRGRRHTATHCNTLQHTAKHCNTLQHTAIHCNTLQRTATYRNILQHTATHVYPETQRAPCAWMAWSSWKSLSGKWRCMWCGCILALSTFRTFSKVSSITILHSQSNGELRESPLVVVRVVWLRLGIEHLRRNSQNSARQSFDTVNLAASWLFRISTGGSTCF